MKNNSRLLFHGLCAFVLLAIVAMILPFPSRAADKLKPEEIVAKNLESIGTVEARAKLNSRIVGGTVVATFVSPSTAQFKGRAVMASVGNKNLISMVF